MMQRQAQSSRTDAAAAASSAASSAATSEPVDSSAGPAARTRARSKRPGDESAQAQTVDDGDDRAAAAPPKRLKAAAASSSVVQSSSHGASSAAAHAAAMHSSTAASSTPGPAYVSLLAPVELQLIFACISFAELRHCWAVSRRWRDEAARLTRSFLKHQGHDGRLRIGRSAMLLLLQSPMRLLVNDLAVLRRTSDARRDKSDNPDLDESAQHSVREFDDYRRPAGSDLDPSALTHVQINIITDRMPQLQHLTAKLTTEQGQGDDGDEESDDAFDEADEDDDDADAEERRQAQAQRDAVKAEAVSLILAGDVAAGTSYRFPRGLVSLRLSPINDSRSSGVGLQVRRVIHSASQLSSLELLSISLRDRPEPDRCTGAHRFRMQLRDGGPKLPGCLAPLRTGAARHSLRVLRVCYPDGVWLHWSVADVQTAFALPRLQRLRLLDRNDSDGVTVGVGHATPTQLREIEEWRPQLDLTSSHSIRRLISLRTFSCVLLNDADPSCLGALTQLEVMRVECWEHVNPTVLSVALSRLTRMRVLHLRHVSMRSQQLTVILAAMPQLHFLTLTDMIALEDFSFLSSIPALALSLRTLRIKQDSWEEREPFDVQRHMSHISALSALTSIDVDSRIRVQPVAAWSQMQLEWTHSRPHLRISKL